MRKGTVVLKNIEHKNKSIRDRLFEGVGKERNISLRYIIYSFYLIVLGVFYKEEDL